MGVSQVAGRHPREEEGALRRLLFLFLFVCAAASAGVPTHHECYELIFHESMRYVFSQEPLLLAPASRWYRSPQHPTHHHHYNHHYRHHRNANSAAMLLSRMEETPMVDFGHGSLDPVDPMQAFADSLEHPHV